MDLAQATFSGSEGMFPEFYTACMQFNQGNGTMDLCGAILLRLASAAFTGILSYILRHLEIFSGY